MKNNLFIGTSTWNYDSWVGLVYSEKRKHAHEYLAEYAKHYNSAGIDSWFYRIPPRKEAEEYRAGVPDDFRFTCKVPQQITLTHERKQAKDGSLVKNDTFLSNELFDEFIGNIEPVLDVMGAIIFEFEYLNKQKMAGVSAFIEQFEAFMKRAPIGLPIALEIRNPNYLTREFFEFLVRNNIIPVFSEKEYLPHIYDVYAEHKEFFAEFEQVVFRLLYWHRIDIEKKTGKQWDKVVEPHDEDLERITKIVIEMIKQLVVVINVNNHYEGSAPKTIEKIQKLLSI